MFTETYKLHISKDPNWINYFKGQNPGKVPRYNFRQETELEI